MLKNKKIILLVSMSLSLTSLASQPRQEEVDFRLNEAKVSSVSEYLSNKDSLKKEVKVEDTKKDLFENSCSQEITMFCSNTKKSNYDCMKENFNLTTGSCKNKLKEEFKKGVANNKLSIHDLKVPEDTVYFGSKKESTYSLGLYKSSEIFNYNNIIFDKGFFKARTYKYAEYKGQFVIYSGMIIGRFKDSSGIEYNPELQKGEFFFDQKGNVKVGTLALDYKYTDKIILKAGSLVAFNDKRELQRGILKHPIRIGKCALLSGMEISEPRIKVCKEN